MLCPKCKSRNIEEIASYSHDVDTSLGVQLMEGGTYHCKECNHVWDT